MVTVLTTYLVISVCALLVSAALVLSAWEHRRFMRRRLNLPLPDGPWPRTAVFAPCRGLDLELEANLHPLLTQDYPDYEVVFILESEQDPACAVIRGLASRYPQVASRIVFSGTAKDSGQKVHNLLAASEDLPDDLEVLAFVDSDARPHSHWLKRLVDRIRKPEVGAATGYRCFVPRKKGISNLLLASINANVAGLLGPHWHNRVWGGSWAIRREVFEMIELRKHWQGTLSDDLVATQQLRRAGMKVAFEPLCLLASPVEITLAQMLEFVRRQFVVGRFYATPLWLTGLLVSTLGVVAFWGGLILSIVAAITRHTLAWVPLAGCGAIYALWVLRGWLRQNALTVFFPQEAIPLRSAARFDLWASPLVSLVNWIGLVASLVGRRIVWRGIRYRLNVGGQIQIEASAPVASQRPESSEMRRLDPPASESHPTPPVGRAINTRKTDEERPTRR